jgi:hypothetical protein
VKVLIHTALLLVFASVALADNLHVKSEINQGRVFDAAGKSG